MKLVRLAGKAEWSTTRGPSGHVFDVEIQAVWDDGKVGANLRVMVAVGDRSRQGFMAPDRHVVDTHV